MNFIQRSLNDGDDITLDSQPKVTKQNGEVNLYNVIIIVREFVSETEIIDSPYFNFL